MSLSADGRNRFAQRLFAPLPSRYDRLEEVLSMGQNRRWRRAMVDQIIPAAASGAGSGSGKESPGGHASPGGHGNTGDRVVLDVASGTAGVALQVAARTGARVVGLDLTGEMLRQGQRNVAAAGAAARIGLVAGRAEQLPFPDASFDALTFTYLLRYVADPESTLRELARVVKPGGMAASLEFCVPPSPFWRSSWWLYTRLLLPAGGLVLGGPAWLRVGLFLGPSISAHCRRYPAAWTAGAWRRAGFRDVGTRLMSLGGGLVMWGRRGDG
jgi:demethylmenaquinone methyltransferase/2-methoxy-6-polyprenyl-1,4-benzoquinol methylase